MPQVFSRRANHVGRVAIFGAPFALGLLGVFLAVFYRSSYVTGAFEVVDQPVPFSHEHHVGQLGIDCRYCHTSVEESSYAGIPPTKVCMNCHQQMWTGADLLAPVRQSYATDDSIPWNKVHNLPHYAYFNHSIHIAKGVGCVSCHGQVDEMPLIFQTQTLLMEWCLSCHRDPEKHLRPREEVFSTTWNVAQETIDPHTGEPYPQDQKALGALLKERYHVRDPEFLTSCSVCHR
ncbi:MAG TPA: cytochrome c3 family protein [Gemmataceae bacterium]